MDETSDPSLWKSEFDESDITFQDCCEAAKDYRQTFSPPSPLNHEDKLAVPTVDDLLKDRTFQPFDEPMSPHTTDIHSLIQRYDVDKEDFSNHIVENQQEPHYPQFYTPTLDRSSTFPKPSKKPPDIPSANG